jgi:MoaA/NifB/PqqE/SkfB family radical SAM enzyme
MSGRPAAPLLATVNVTSKCNLTCPYCFMQPLTGQFIDPKDFARVLDQLADMRIFLLTLSGGEPFLHPAIYDILIGAYTRFSNTLTISNGTVLSRRHEKAISDILESTGSFRIQISLDSIDVTTNAKTRGRTGVVVRHIQRLAAMGCQVTVATVVTRHNVETVPTTIEFMAQYTPYFHIMVVQDVRGAQGVEASLSASPQQQEWLWPTLDNIAKRRGLTINTPTSYGEAGGSATGAPCIAGFTQIVIDPDLRVRPCDRLIDVVVGDLRHSSLADVWNGDALRHIVNSAQRICLTPSRTRLRVPSSA